MLPKGFIREDGVATLELGGYYEAIDSHGIDATWAAICARIMGRLRPDLRRVDAVPVADVDVAFSDAWSPEQLPDVYEAGLAHVDKMSKKSLGQYYTPADTGRYMALGIRDALDGEGKILVEPCVGCGNLLIVTLRELTDPWEVMCGRMVLFDCDGTAMSVAVARAVIEFAPRGASVDMGGFDCRQGDFLLSGFHAGDGHVVISNPPYGKTSDPAYASHETYGTRDLYTLFIEHLVGAHKTAIVVPQGFLGSPKFSSLRRVMSERAGGDVIPYDNIPASMFNKRKHGVFNTNTSNSVRAAIVFSERGLAGSGWRVAPMLRWVAAERPDLFAASDRLLEGARRSTGEDPWPKVPARLVPLYEELSRAPRLSTLVDPGGAYELHVPSTPRYFVTASDMPLRRSAFHTLRFSDPRKRNLAYVVVNSSLSYCWWRWHDGGIMITQGTLMDVPVPRGVGDDVDALAESMMSSEADRLIVKMNAGKPNENLKFSPEEIAEATRAAVPGRSEAEYAALAASHANNLGDAVSAWVADESPETPGD